MKADYSLYLVTDRLRMSTDTLGGAVEQAVTGGCTMVQIREKDLSARAFYGLASEIKKITDQYNIPLIINDRADIAMAVGAAGVHIGQGDLPAGITRKMIGRDMLLGVSVHSVLEAEKAVAAGADYLGVGAIFPTRTKPNAEPVPLEELAKIRRMTALPIVAIGGVSRENAGIFRAMGIDGLAVVSAVIAQPDIRRAAAELRHSFFCTRAGEEGSSIF